MARRLTEDEKQERIDVARMLIGMGKYRGEIKSMIARQYGITTRSAERYYTDATRQIREEVEQTDEELISKSLAFYEQIIRSKDANDMAKIKARERMDKILGIDVLRVSIGKTYREKLEELGIDPDEAGRELREALGDALQSTTKSPDREN